ncbi:MAG: acyl-CoA dehydrogenase family protein [Bacteroidia bacterium]
MNYYFTEEHNLFREGLRQFLDKEVMPNIDQWEEDQRIPKDLWKKFGDMGYMGLNYPEEYGGMNADFFYSVIFCEEVCKCFSGGFAVAPMVMQFMATPYIFQHGSEFLKQKYLVPSIAGEAVSSIAISEPGAGSDVANIKTKAIREEDHYIVNGSKTFITNGVYGDYLIMVVKTNPDAGVGGISLLIIDRDAPGVSATKLKKLGWHASDTAELAFDNVKVPVENLIGEEGQGFYYLMGGLQVERLTGAIGAVAGAESALDYALDYMAQREAFGRPINRFQVLRHRVADLATEIEATRYFVYHLCRVHNDGLYAVKECSMAKLKATELSDRAMTECLQFFGGYGFMEEYKIARMFRDSRVLTIGGGSSEIMREIIAKMVIDDKNYNRANKQLRATQIPASNGHASKPTASQKVIVNPELITLSSITLLIKKRSEGVDPIGATLKFAFDEGSIFVDGVGDKNDISNSDEGAQCTIATTLVDFSAILRGKLDPMSAFMQGKFKVEGDMSLAMKLPQLFR